MKILGKLNRYILALLCFVASHSTWAILAINDNYIIAQDTTFFLIDPLANDIVDLGSLAGFTNGDLVLQAGLGSVDTANGIAVTPAPGFVGTLVFTYTITDNTGTDSAQIYIRVEAAPAPHQAVNDFHHVLQNASAINLNVLANDNFNPSNGAEIVAVSSSAQGETIAIGGTALSVLYQPPTGYTGVDTFTYDLQDLQTSVISQAVVTVFVGVEPQTGTPIATATNEEQDTINAIEQLCILDPDSPLPCALISSLTDEQKRNLAQQVGGRHAKAQSRAMRQIKNRQTNNVRSRLAEVRSQTNRVSVRNLNTVVLNEAVPLGQAFQPIVNDTVSGGAAGDDSIATPWGFFINGNISVGEGIGENDRPQ